MESNEPAREHAADTLARLDAARDAWVRDLRLPAGYHPAIGTAIALQVATLAWALADADLTATAAMVGGTVVLGVVVAWQIRRFREVNGTWVGGFAVRAVLGATYVASIGYAAGLAAASWAAFAGAWWLTVLAAVATGVAYAAAGQWWLRCYRAHPESEATGAAGRPGLLTTALAVVAVAGLVLVLLGR